MEPVRWGILGTANIALAKVIPAMAGSHWARIMAIASRDPERAGAAARSARIPRAYGTYEELLADPGIEAIYNPLPNHLHVPWSIHAAEQGKHVLCEKPVALSVKEARELLAVRDRTGVQISEAFMVRSHPQWLKVRELTGSGRIGQLRLIHSQFSYSNRDPQNIRNRPEYGGGALMDIGCYPVTLARWLFGAEPEAVIALIERDPDMRTDRLTSGMLRFDSGHATFDCSTQLVPSQRLQVFGTTGRIEVEIPFNTPPEGASRIHVDDGRDLRGRGIQTIEFAAVNQYTLQCDEFSMAVRGLRAVPVPLEDAIGNMAVIEALFRSEESGRWEVPDASG